MIKLGCGLKVKWEATDAFKNESLIVVDNNCHCKNKCGNPWNHMADDETKYVKSLRKIQEPPYGMPVLLRTETFETLDDVMSDMKELIGADCWGVFTTSSDRKSISIYFDNRTSSTDNDNEKRETLMDDTTSLGRDIEKGLTVVIILGGNPFLDIYYSKTNNIMLKNIVDHTLLW